MPAAGENGEPLTLLDLFRQGVYEGGEEEAIEAYEEAMEAIFGMHVASHRHTQCTYSKKRPGQKRFVMFEMWPLAVRCLPVCQHCMLVLLLEGLLPKVPLCAWWCCMPWVLYLRACRIQCTMSPQYWSACST